MKTTNIGYVSIADIRFTLTTMGAFVIPATYPYVEIVGITSQKKTLSGNKTPKYGLWKRPNKLALVL